MNPSFLRLIPFTSTFLGNQLGGDGHSAGVKIFQAILFLSAKQGHTAMRASPTGYSRQQHALTVASSSAPPRVALPFVLKADHLSTGAMARLKDRSENSTNAEDQQLAKWTLAALEKGGLRHQEGPKGQSTGGRSEDIVYKYQRQFETSRGWQLPKDLSVIIRFNNEEGKYDITDLQPQEVHFSPSRYSRYSSVLDDPSWPSATDLASNRQGLPPRPGSAAARRNPVVARENKEITVTFEDEKTQKLSADELKRLYQFPDLFITLQRENGELFEWRMGGLDVSDMSKIRVQDPDDSAKTLQAASLVARLRKGYNGFNKKTSDYFIKLVNEGIIRCSTAAQEEASQ